MNTEGDVPELSIVSPAHDEQDNLEGLVADVRDALRDSGFSYELIVVDDGSKDQTLAVGRRLMADAENHLRVLSLDTPRGRGLGPSAGYAMGIRMARGRLLAIIDADRQNDPSDIPAMIRIMQASHADMVQGDRSANRNDHLIRRLSSRVGRGFRRALLGDEIRDAACAMRVMKIEVARAIPFGFKGMQRFAAYYAAMIGYRVVQTPVNHRPRTAGRAKFGVWNRALPGLIDLLAVRWMKSRWRRIELKPDAVHEPRTRETHYP